VRLQSFTLAVCLLGFAQPALSEERADNLVKAFLGSCVNVLPRVDKIEATANSLKWKELTGDDLKAMAPQDPSSVTKDWFADVAGTPPFFIATALATENGQKISSCSLANPEAPPNDVLASLKQFLKLGEPQAQKTEGGIQTRVWITDIASVHLWISLNDSSPTNDPGVTLGAMTRE
jgi:hypothetical protein